MPEHPNALPTYLEAAGYSIGLCCVWFLVVWLGVDRHRGKRGATAVVAILGSVFAFSTSLGVTPFRLMFLLLTLAGVVAGGIHDYVLYRLRPEEHFTAASERWLPYQVAALCIFLVAMYHLANLDMILTNSFRLVSFLWGTSAYAFGIFYVRLLSWFSRDA